MPEKKLVFDATALSNFFLSDAVSLLIRRYQRRGIITWEVYDELCGGFKKFPALQGVEFLLAPRCFSLVSLSKKEHAFYISLLDSLGKGEASCIAHARYSNAVVVSDDKAARRLCETLGIKCTGTIGILLAASRDGHVDPAQADRILHSMIHTGFYSPVRNISDII